MVSLIEHDKSAAIFEPCAGHGVFLKSLGQHGFRDVTAYEIDDSLENMSDTKIQYKDTLLERPHAQYDAVIGNPPYVRWKNIDPQKRQLLKSNAFWESRINGLNDLLYLFILLSVNSLKEGGELIFITPTFWTSTMHSKTLREKLLKEGEITHFINFEEAKVFDRVSSNILIFRFVKKKTNQQMKVIKVLTKERVGKRVLEDINHILNKLDDDGHVRINGYEAYLHKQFNKTDPWNPVPAEVEPVIKRIEDNADSRLGDIANICNGMVSGLDEAFKVDSLDDFTDEERRLMVKVIKAKNMNRYFPNTYTNYIFLNDKIKDEEGLERLPDIASRLTKFKTKLKARYDYNKDIPWWHWVFLRNRDAIEKSRNKIVVPSKERYNLRGHVRFALAEGNFFITQDITAIIKKPEIKENTKYLLAVLNSDLIFLWLRYKGLRRGGVMEFSEKPLSVIPIKRIDWDNPSEVKLHNEIVELVDRIVSSKDKMQYDSDINGLVEKLYHTKTDAF